MRFLIDAPLSPKTALWLTTQGHDAVHLLSVGMLTAPDEKIVRLAAEEGRIVITMDLAGSIAVLEENRIRLHRLPLR